MLRFKWRRLKIRDDLLNKVVHLEAIDLDIFFQCLVQKRRGLSGELNMWLETEC